MKAIHRSTWYGLTRVAPGALALHRSDSPFDSMTDLRDAHEPLLGLLGSERPERLLIDLRDAPSRNDVEFEDHFSDYRARLTGTAEHTGLLLRSQVGALQVQRLARRDGVELRVFHDEELARAWLAQGASATPPSGSPASGMPPSGK